MRKAIKPLRYAPAVTVHDRSRTYAFARQQFVLCDPQGKPLSIHGSFDGALGRYVESRKGIILDDNTRERYFEVMLRKRYSIRKAFVWVRVDSETIKKLPPTRKARR